MPTDVSEGAKLREPWDAIGENASNACHRLSDFRTSAGLGYGGRDCFPREFESRNRLLND